MGILSWLKYRTKYQISGVFWGMLSWLKYITNYLGILENAELVEILSLTLGFMVDFSVVVGVSKPATTGGGTS